jgi:hypothetical protein
LLPSLLFQINLNYKVCKNLIKKDFSFSQRGVRFLVDTINSRRTFYFYERF